MTFQTVPPAGGAPRQVAHVVNLAMAGKINATITVTLDANASSTVVADERLTRSAFLGFDPLTAHAATELANGTLYALAANRLDGSVTLTHANSAQTDRTFLMLIIG